MAFIHILLNQDKHVSSNVAIIFMTVKYIAKKAGNEAIE